MASEEFQAEFVEGDGLAPTGAPNPLQGPWQEVQGSTSSPVAPEAVEEPAKQKASEELEASRKIARTTGGPVMMQPEEGRQERDALLKEHEKRARGESLRPVSYTHLTLPTTPYV